MGEKTPTVVIVRLTPAQRSALECRAFTDEFFYGPDDAPACLRGWLGGSRLFVPEEEMEAAIDALTDAANAEDDCAEYRPGGDPHARRAARSLTAIAGRLQRARRS